MLYNDTIVALATPPGEGGIGVIRISGPQAITILDAIFQPIRPGRWRAYRLRLGSVVDADATQIDQALAVLMRAPRSFTGEDVVEISCHGGPLVLGQVLGCALAQGARAANPGEFTMRAFLNGRIDLTQAEATLDVITAQTSTGLALAQAQLGGWLTQALSEVRRVLLDPLAYCTALVDFPEDEVEVQPIREPLQIARNRLSELAASAKQGMIYRQGARAAIIGRPNAGKSSLLNALLQVERAIVTPIPGTTRDTLEETASLGGVPVVLIDTAGMTETHDLVEQLGIERSRTALAGADLALLVVDASVATPADPTIAQLTAEKPTILVLNKLDLLGNQTAIQATTAALCETWTAARGRPFITLIGLSAATGHGISELSSAVARLLLGDIPRSDAQLITNPRHREALTRAISHVDDGLRGLDAGIPHDLLAVDITAALTSIGEITGEAVGDDLLHTIFSRFCIGK
jgi:tRNA modification GTPase